MKKMKKALSLLLALAMVLGMVNLTAFAAGEPDTNQIGEYLVYDDAGIADGTTNGKSEKTIEADGVTLSKTIERTEAENVFGITLQVTTTKQETTITPDAAVTLVYCLDDIYHL